jgi:hypothetical protein
MPLIVEDGTGLANAEAYLSVAAFKTWADAWGKSYTGQTDTVIEQKLRAASAYIDTLFRYKGQRLQAAQAMEFPRVSLVDWSGLTVTGVPNRVKTACAELTFKAFSEELYVDLDRGGRVTSESVGPISVSYAPDAPEGKTFRFAQQLLAPFVRKDGDLLNPPFFSTSDAPMFEIGGMDNPPIVSEE